jgi:hypothetical protein
VRVVEGVSFLVVWVTVPRNYFVHFFSPLELKVFFFAISNCTDRFMRLSKQEMKPETSFITIAKQLRPVALKWCMTYLRISTGSLFIHFGIRVLVSFEVTVCYTHGVP